MSRMKVGAGDVARFIKYLSGRHQVLGLTLVPCKRGIVVGHAYNMSTGRGEQEGHCQLQGTLSPNKRWEGEEKKRRRENQRKK